ncbi:MAG TPA: molecular chaperone DnaK, partial [Thermoplasmatales archaeon]|nr:molecular chaperone DnaK [Thermoplasmatales archaeon]
LQTEINLPYITVVDGEPKHLEMKLSRAQLEQLIEPIIDKSFGPCKQALEDAKLKPEDIDHIVLVGGTTRIPLIRKKVEEFFGKAPERGVDPMECVAVGAAIQAGVLSGAIDKEIVLLDVTPLTLSVETLGGVATPIIPRNTTIPVRRSKIFTTAADNQTTVEIHVVQGERSMAADNKSLGRFHLTGIPPAPRGIPQIEVTFDIDVNGILNVSAKDLATGKEQSIKITGSTKLSDEEVERMRKEAEAHAEEDRKRKEKIETRNNAENLIYTAERTIKELGDKISEEDKKAIDTKIDELRKALTGDNIEEIKKKTEELSSELQKIGAKAYQQAAAQGVDKENKEEKETWKGHPSDDKTIDADYKVKDKK